MRKDKDIKRKIISEISFGSRVAEDELDNLRKYFVQTDQWNQILKGEIDIVYGPKGAGKSAMYLLLVNNASDLRRKFSVRLINAENPRGKTAFKEIETSPPTQESAFINLWKLYIITLVGRMMQTMSLSGSFMAHLKAAKLLEPTSNLDSLVTSISRLVRRITQPKSVQMETKLSPQGDVSGVSTKIEPGDATDKILFEKLDDYLNEINQIAEENKTKFWIAFDRLDVAFSENAELEGNAIKALMRVYLDLKQFPNLALKLFIRTDIWDRIAKAGFREASHITRSLTISWNEEDMISLILNRLFQKTIVRNFYSLEGDLSTIPPAKKKKLFDSIFPTKVEGGAKGKKPDTLKWLISRTQDGSKTISPREIIHLLSETRNQQAHRLESGHAPPAGKFLFEGIAIRNALPIVSTTKLEQTIYAEYPSLKEPIKKLEGKKSEQTSKSLSQIWGASKDETNRIIGELIQIGFFEKRGTGSKPMYWVPFLFRSALNLVQGKSKL